MAMVLSTVLGAIAQASIEGAWRKSKRSEVVLRLLSRFGLDRSDSPTDFDSIYARAPIQYGVFKPESVLNFFRNEFVRAAFRETWYRDDLSVLEREAEGIIQWNEETRALGAIDYDPRREFAAFTAVFTQIVDRSRTPAEVRRDQLLAEAVQRLDGLATLEEVRGELSKLSMGHSLVKSAGRLPETGRQSCEGGWPQVRPRVVCRAAGSRGGVCRLSGVRQVLLRSC